MARPTRTKIEHSRGKMRTVALMRELAQRVGAENPHQFAGWFDKQTGVETQASGKWRLNFSGDRPLSPQQLQMLSRIDGDVAHLHCDGPADLWRALWGDVHELWPLCRNRFCDVGPMLDDRTWSEIEGEFGDEKTFGSALREFEGELLLADAYCAPLSVRHLTEVIALYRLHQHLNSIAPSDTDGIGAYRCVRMCLDDRIVQGELHRLGVGELLRDYLAEMEIGRLNAEPSYRAAINVDSSAQWIINPRAVVSDNVRWQALAFDWVS